MKQIPLHEDNAIIIILPDKLAQSLRVLFMGILNVYGRGIGCNFVSFVGRRGSGYRTRSARGFRKINNTITAI